MKVLVTGGNSGQLKWELLRTLPDSVTLVGPQDRLDITDAKTVVDCVTETCPDIVINAAAYTAVDKAEESADQAYLVNETGVRNLAAALADSSDSARLLHVSTDFVFGVSTGEPFTDTSPTAPVSVYGASKLAGEKAALSILPARSLILRTAWVYSSFGNNFVNTMLRLMRERGEVGVIADQVGAPTWANSLAQALWRAAGRPVHGIHHWTDAGACSWYDFAVAINEEALALGLLDKPATVNPLRTDQYPTPAKRPNYSLLETTRTWAALDYQPSHWRAALRKMLKELL